MFNFYEQVKQNEIEENQKVKDLKNRFTVEELQICKKFINYYFYSEQEFKLDDKESNKYDILEKINPSLNEKEYPFGFISLQEDDTYKKLKTTLLDIDIILSKIFEIKLV